MMLHRHVFALAVAFATVWLPGSSPAASTSPGKTGVYASTTAAVIFGSPATVLTATIEKGKKKRVVEVEVASTVTASPPGAGALIVTATVNGLPILEPTNAGSTVSTGAACLNPPTGCSVTAQYWLDLDAVEAAHPGVFVKQPLNIAVQAGWTGRGGPPDHAVSGVVSLRARFAKK
jgi:hypothetical protein